MKYDSGVGTGDQPAVEIPPRIDLDPTTFTCNPWPGRAGGGTLGRWNGGRVTGVGVWLGEKTDRGTWVCGEVSDHSCATGGPKSPGSVSDAIYVYGKGHAILRKTKKTSLISIQMISYTPA